MKFAAYVLEVGPTDRDANLHCLGTFDTREAGGAGNRPIPEQSGPSGYPRPVLCRGVEDNKIVRGKFRLLFSANGKQMVLDKASHEGVRLTELNNLSQSAGVRRRLKSVDADRRCTAGALAGDPITAPTSAKENRKASARTR